MIYMDRLEEYAQSAAIPVKRPPMDTRRAAIVYAIWRFEPSFPRSWQRPLHARAPNGIDTLRIYDSC
jgi:hypothetical protein